MIRKANIWKSMWENKVVSALILALLGSAGNAVRQQVDVSQKDNVARSRRAENWRKTMDLEQAVTVLSNKIYMLENPQKKPKR